MRELTDFEREALTDPGARDAHGNCDVLNKVGKLLRELRQHAGLSPQQPQQEPQQQPQELSGIAGHVHLVAGMLSAAAMALPAWKAESLTASVAQFRAALSKHRPPGGDPDTAAVLTDLERLAAAWKAPDRRLRRAGVVPPSMSFLLKMDHHAGWQF